MSEGDGEGGGEGANGGGSGDSTEPSDGGSGGGGGGDSAADGQAVAAAARWASTPRLIADLLHSGDLTLPGVVRMQRGPVLLLPTGRRRHLVGQAVKLRPGRAASTSTAVGPRLAIPETYPGWFELLSEDGRAGRCVASVAELARRPQPCLVRAALRGTAADNGGSVLLRPGDTITPVGSVGRYLRANTSAGAAVLLPVDSRARLLPIAGEHNISGAHCARTLLAKRLPLTARLLHGAAPRPPRAELRLLAAFQDELLLAIPLQGTAPSPPVAIPAGAGGTVVRARNHDALRRMPEFRRLADRGTRLSAEAADRIVVLEGACKLPERRPSSAPAVIAQLPPPTATPDEYDEIDQIYAYVRGFAPLPKSLGTPPPPPPVETIPGKKPPPTTASQPAVSSKAEKRSRSKEVPTTRLFVKNGRASAACRVLRPKAAAANLLPPTPPSPPPSHGLFGVRYKSMSNIHGASTEADQDGTVDSSLSGGNGGGGGSSGTTGATGGPTSASSTQQSNGGKVPEKSRRLSRPRSLTNLVWGSAPTAAPVNNGDSAAARLSVAGNAGAQRLGTLYL